MSNDPERPWAGRKCAYCFTTDDGHEDNVNFGTVFDSFGLKFTAFVNEGTIGTGAVLTQAELEALATNHEIGNHTNGNTVLSPSLTDQQLADEVDRAPLEALLGNGYRVKTFAYPSHVHDYRVMGAVKDAGYIGARNGTISDPSKVSSYTAVWDESRANILSRYEIPVRTSWGNIVNGNLNDESTTKANAAARATAWKNERILCTMIAHNLGDVDEQHLTWTLEVLAADPDIWIVPFHVAIQYFDLYRGRQELT